MLALLLAPILGSGAAHAACAVEQRDSETGVDVVVQALDEPVGCRAVTLTSDRPITIEAWVWTPEARRSRVRADHLRALPGGGWEIGVPELVPGGSLQLAVDVPGDTLQIRLSRAPADAPPATAQETRTLTLDARHPGWGFADPTRATTRVEQVLTFPADGAARVVPVPTGATDIAAGGLALVPNGVAVPAGTPSATIAYTVAGAEAQGARTLPPGSLTLKGPDVAWHTSVGEGVTATPIEGGVRFDAPNGGGARWRVERAGAAAVIPDLDTYVAGVDWKFVRVSLPEPAVPMALRGKNDRAELFADLVAEVRALRDGSLPGADPLQPRQLNKAWRSGWVTPVERALVLHRFLTQERFRAGWVLTGEQADPETFTGYDHLLVTALVDGNVAWLDPACMVCGPGEIGTRWLGKPALGADVQRGTEAVEGKARKTFLTPMPPLAEGARVPTAPGRLDRTLTLQGDRFHARFSATGAAALWLRERIVGTEPGARAGKLGDALGMPDARIVEATGFETAGAPIVLLLEGGRPPEDPFPAPDATPWAGGWGDAL